MPMSLLLCLALSSVPKQGDRLVMPPPPSGMRVLGEEEKKQLLRASADPEDETDAPEEEDQDSAELEEVRALEEVALDPAAQPKAEVLQSVNRLGLGSPLRMRMLDALDEDTLREDSTPAELAPVSDLASFDVGLVQDRYDIPLDMQPLVAQYIRFFQGPGRKWFRKWMGRSTRFLPVMQPILEQRGMPQDTVYLAMIESGFSTSAYSWAHASGPWQFISSTGKQYGLKQDFWVDERRDPVKATEAAAKYLAQLHSDLGHWYLAWAAYNTGAGRVRRTIAKKGTSDFWEISDGKGLAKETKHYVPKLIAAALVAKNPRAFGFDEAEFDFLPPMQFEEVKVVDPTDLEVIARAAGVPVQEVKELNPELKRWCTPPATEKNPYVLRLPVGVREQYAQNIAKLGPRERMTFQIHRVKRGDTLSQIAAVYRSAPEAILQLNRMRNPRALRVNTDLVIPVPSAHAAADGKTDLALARQVAKARRAGIVSVRPEEEIPAGTMTKALATGPIKTETVNGKTRLTYGVQNGDSLWAISQRFAVTVDEIRRWNGLSARARGLQVGTVLELWPGEKAAVGERAGTVVAAKAAPAMAATPQAGGVARKVTHQLAAGETLWSIAQRYGVTVEDIKRWNGIRNHRALQIGTALTVMTAP